MSEQIIESIQNVSDEEILAAAEELIKSELAAQELEALEKAKTRPVSKPDPKAQNPEIKVEDAAKSDEDEEEIEKSKEKPIEASAESKEEEKEELDADKKPMKKKGKKEEKKVEEEEESKKEEVKKSEPVVEVKPIETPVVVEAPKANPELEELKTLVKSLSEKLDTLSKEKEDLSKSIKSDEVEILVKSYSSKIQSQEKIMEEMKKSYTSQIEELKKSQEELAKSLSKPARKRESVTNFDVIEKGNSETAHKLYKSKNEVLEALEDLRKSGKISGDEVIAYNVSNILSPNARKQLLKG